MQVQCAYCGKTLTRKPSRVKKYATQFCNQDCLGAYRAIPVIVTCHHCGKECQKKPSQIRERNFCSNACNFACRAGEASGRWKGGPVTVECDQCGKTFEKDADQLGEHNFCSRACNGAYRIAPVTVECDQCGKAHNRVPSKVGERNFCSLECSYAFREPTVTVTCSHCGKTLRRSPSQVHGQNFCSHPCMAAAKRGEASPFWKGGKPDGEIYGPDWKKIAAAIRKRDNYTCQHCGKRQPNQRKAFAVHHITPLRDFSVDQIEEANQLSNLITLCYSCHTKVHRAIG